MPDFDTIDYFTDQSLVTDPLPYFEHLRAQCPVTTLPHRGVVAVTGYDEAAEVWRDHATYSSCNAVTGPLPGLPFTPEGDDIGALIEEHRHTLPMAEYLIAQDPPTHTHNRGLLMKLLTPSRLKQNEDFIQSLAARQIAKVVDRGCFEVLSEFAQPFALLVIADLLGVPESDHRAFSHQLGAEFPDGGIGEDDRAQSRDPLNFLFETFSRYIVERRAEPRQDVLTQLALATFPDGGIPEVADVVRTATFLFAAGQDTTARLIQSAMQHLGDDAELQARIRREPDRIPDLLEEVLRLDGPVKTISRTARVSTELAGQAVAAGTTIAIFPHAVNRDPRRFPDPERLDIDRANVRTHVAFGRGIHSCPGGSLARAEARIALELLLARTTAITVSEEHHGPLAARRYDYEPTYILRGIRELHVTVTP